MIPSIFREPERRFLLGKVEEWESLKGSGRQRNEDGDLVSYRDEFIVELMQEFFNTFPERDLTRQPGNPLAFKQADRDRLHSRLRNFLNNHPSTRERSTDEVRPPAPYYSVLVLFKQRFNERILAERNRLKAGSLDMSTLQAYNRAVQTEFEKWKADVPEEHEAMVALVDEMRSARDQGFHTLANEVQEAVLALFPAEIVGTLKAWEKRTGAACYIMSTWRKPDGSLAVFDWASSQCRKFTQSNEAQEILATWTEWMREHTDLCVAETGADPAPQVYPDEHGRPTLPELDVLQAGMPEEKRVLRRYMTSLSMFQGGDRPSYTAIERRFKEEGRAPVEACRMPPRVQEIRELRNMKQLDLNAWIKHVLAGQKGLIPDSQKFQWLDVPGTRGKVARIASAYERERHPTSRLEYTRAELLYGERVKSQQDDDAGQVNWNGLPLARTSHVYVPFTTEAFRNLQLLHRSSPEFINLLKEITAMERYGPVHLDRSMTDQGSTFNIHIPQSSQTSLTNRLCPAEWLPRAFFDESHEDHPQWSMVTLLQWIQQSNAYMHPESGTAFGGPFGVRTVVFALSRVLQSLDRIKYDQQGERQDMPADVRVVTRTPGTRWASDLTVQRVHQGIAHLRRQVARSCTVLEVTFKARANAWEDAVFQRHAESQSLEVPHRMENSRVQLTSGLPAGRSVIHTIYQTLKARRQLSEEEDDIAEASFAFERQETLNEVPSSFAPSGPPDHSDTSESAIPDIDTHVGSMGTAEQNEGEHIEIPADWELSGSSDGDMRGEKEKDVPASELESNLGGDEATGDAYSFTLQGQESQLSDRAPSAGVSAASRPALSDSILPQVTAASKKIGGNARGKTASRVGERNEAPMALSSGHSGAYLVESLTAGSASASHTRVLETPADIDDHLRGHALPVRRKSARTSVRSAQAEEAIRAARKGPKSKMNRK